LVPAPGREAGEGEEVTVVAEGLNAIVDLLAETRKSSGISLGALSRRTGYDKRGISGWERKKNVPSLQCAMDWANALGYQIVMVKTGYEVKPGGRQ
jgi:transcriptional regulator with XRE-family HTH domain